MDQFIRGKEDIYREFQLKDNGTILDASDFTEITISFQDDIGNKLVEYTLGDSEVSIVDGDLGTVSCIIPKATHADKRLCQYKAQIVTTEADNDYPGSVRTRAGQAVNFELIREIS